MADYNSDRTGSNIDLTLDKVDALDAKVQPTATGANVTGTLVADGLTVDGDATVQSQSGNNATFLIGQSGITNWRLINEAGTGDLKINDSPTSSAMRIVNNGNVSFYEDTGTTAKMVWDASAETLTVPQLDVEGANSSDSTVNFSNSGSNIVQRIGGLTSAHAGLQTTIRLQGKNTANTTSVYADIKIDPDNQLLILSDPGVSGSSIGTNPVVIDSAGNVGIGTTSPSAPLSLNRTVSDGTILDFRKDGTTVGSIASDSGNILQLNSGGDDKGVFLARNGSNVVGFAPNEPDVFRPATFDTCDLGKSDRRFKDLYLSGGVKFSESTITIQSGTPTTVASFGVSSGSKFCGIIYVRDTGGTLVGASAIVTVSANGSSNLIELTQTGSGSPSSSLTVSGSNIQFTSGYLSTRTFRVTLTPFSTGG